MLGNVDFYSIFELIELLVYFNYLLEVQLLEVYVHPPHQKVDQIALLEFVVAQTPQSFEHF